MTINFDRKKAKKRDHKEANYENRAVAFAKRRGVKAFKFQLPGRRAAPDRIFIIPGAEARIFFIEFKRSKTSRYQPLQKRFIKMLLSWGVTVYAASSYTEGREAILKELARAEAVKT